MNKSEAKRWANDTAAGLIESAWDQCDWDEKTGPDAERIDLALKDIVSKLRRLGPLPDDRKPALE